MDTAVSRHTQTDTRKLILRTARELLLTRSYLGLSFQDLADRVGIRKASLYHHFPSKEALGIAVIEDSLQRFQRWQDGLASQTAASQFLAYIHMFRDQIGAGHRVCPIGATGGEWECLEPALQDTVRRLHQAHLDWLAQVALRLDPGARAASPTAEMHTSARQWAAQVNAICQGALINARMHADVGMFDTALAPLVSRLNQAH